MEIKVHSKGAELKSLKNPVTGTEYLWQGDPAFWNRSSPILFPFVGKTDRNEFRTKGKTYSMTQHGFARDMEFELLSRTEDEIWFVLKDSEETRQKYPYGFTLKLGYRLFDNGVEVCWQVENEEEEELPFSIGGHPAFYCPIDEGAVQTDYLLRFDCKDQVVCTRISDEGLALNEEDVYPLKDVFLPITEHLFDRDALVIEEDQSKEVALVKPDGRVYLTVRFDAPLFGIWSPPGKNAPFICIEPWYGRCDDIDYTGTWEERKWGQRLAPGESFEASYQIIV